MSEELYIVVVREPDKTIRAVIGFPTEEAADKWVSLQILLDDDADTTYLVTTLDEPY